MLAPLPQPAPLRPRVTVRPPSRRTLFARALRARLLPHAIVVLVGWPVLSVLEAVAALPRHTIMAGLPPRVAFVGMVAGIQLLAAEILAVGALCLVVSLGLCSLAATLAPDGARDSLPPWILRAAEPIVLLLAAYLGVMLEFPAALLHPIVSTLQEVSVATATLLLALIVAASATLVGLARGGGRAGLASLLVAAGVTLACWRIGSTPVAPPAREAGSKTWVLFGIDSLSQTSGVEPLRELTRSAGGTWYERAVTPGLLTNAVWPAILMRRLPHETGTFFIFQPVDWARSPYNLVREARGQGLETVSHFSDQFTTHVGSTGGFDVDASGPTGWKQIATAALKDASLLLPVLLPHLPPVPGAGTPANQSGTFAFDVRAEIATVLTAGAGADGSLVAAHLDYLHQARYPSFGDLTAEERARVRAARVDALRDHSLHWQYPSARDEPLGLYRWKIRHVQRLLAEELERTHFLDPTKQNRLIVFSDHGERIHVHGGNFGEAQYSHVVLATFGIAPRGAEAPISLLELGPMIGLPDPSRPTPAPAAVEYTNVNRDEWAELLKSSSIRATGEIDPDSSIVARLGERMRANRPWDAPGVYTPAPSHTPALRK